MRVVQVVFMAVRSARRAVFSISRFGMTVSQVARSRDRAAVPDGAGADGQEPSGGSIGRIHESLPFSQARPKATAKGRKRQSPPARFSPPGSDPDEHPALISVILRLRGGKRAARGQEPSRARLARPRPIVATGRADTELCIPCPFPRRHSPPDEGDRLSRISLSTLWAFCHFLPRRPRPC